MSDWEILEGDCREKLGDIHDETVDLVVTSPPYAAQRKRTYGGVPPDEYVDWFLPIGEELSRVLKPTGTFILNIKENVEGGQRHPYVFNLVCALQAAGWWWTETFVWHKRNCTPGKWPNRFRDAWEFLFQFNKQKHFTMYQDAVRVPVGDWAATRIPNLSEADRERHTSQTGSGFGRNVGNWADRDLVYPTNVLHLATECGSKGHSAVFPCRIPEWFIRLFTQEGDLVLDPFSGSGTTGVAAVKLQRRYLGIEVLPEYAQQSRLRLGAPPSEEDLALHQEERRDEWRETWGYSNPFSGE